MSTPANADKPAQAFPLQDPAGDEAREHTHHHDPASEIAHAKEHLRENNWWFLCIFLPVILISVMFYVVDFGPWNKTLTWVWTVVRSGCIALFLAHLFKEFSFVYRTLAFTFFFLLGMIFLSLWDSEVKPLGDPIKDHAHPETDKV